MQIFMLMLFAFSLLHQAVQCEILITGYDAVQLPWKQVQTSETSTSGLGAAYALIQARPLGPFLM